MSPPRKRNPSNRVRETDPDRVDLQLDELEKLRATVDAVGLPRAEILRRMGLKGAPSPGRKAHSFGTTWAWRSNEMMWSSMHRMAWAAGYKLELKLVPR